MAKIAAALLALLAGIAASRWRRRTHPARTVIVSPRGSTVIAADGAVRSTQTAHLSLPQEQLQRLWTPANLENLGSTYWRFLSRATFGLVRVMYRQHDRSVVLLARPLTLLRFDAPVYELERDHGKISWRIRDGLLVSRANTGSGGLSLEVRKLDGEHDPATLMIRVEVANFYPAIASGLGTAVYEATQAFVHVLVTHAFLRSLASLNLVESRVRRFPH